MSYESFFFAVVSASGSQTTQKRYEWKQFQDYMKYTTIGIIANTPTRIRALYKRFEHSHVTVTAVYTRRHPHIQAAERPYHRGATTLMPSPTML